MLEFIVLGIIPGTHTQLSLNWIAGLGAGLFSVLVVAHAVRRAMRTKHASLEVSVAVTDAAIAAA